MSTQQAAGQQGRNIRTESQAPRLSRAEMTAYTAANLMSLMAWLYAKPQN